MKVGENMFQMTLNKHAKFHGDRNHRWRYNSEKGLKTQYF